MHVYTNVCMYIHTSQYINVCVRVCMVCTYVCACVRACVCMYMCACFILREWVRESWCTDSFYRNKFRTSKQILKRACSESWLFLTQKERNQQDVHGCDMRLKLSGILDLKKILFLVKVSLSIDVLVDLFHRWVIYEQVTSKLLLECSILGKMFWILIPSLWESHCGSLVFWPAEVNEAR